MARTILEHQEERLTFPPDTILELKIDEAEVTEQQRRDGSGSWEKLRVKFKILGVQAVGDGSNPSDYDNWITDYIWGSVSFKLTDSPNNQLRLWLEAIFRTELGLGFEFDTNMIIGRTCRGITSQYPSKTLDPQGKPLMRHQVESLLSWGGVSHQPVSTPAVDPWANAMAGQQNGTPPVAPAPQQAQQQTLDPWATQPAWSADDPPPF